MAIQVDFSHQGRMTTFAFRQNPNFLYFKSASDRIVVWLDRYLNTQEGIFRISKLTKDAFEFIGKVAQNTRFAGVAAWTSLAAKVSGYGVMGTTLPHLYNLTVDLVKQTTNGGLLKTVKRVSDCAAGAIYGAMLITSSAAAFATHANFITLAGDLVELYMEGDEFSSISEASVDPRFLSQMKSCRQENSTKEIQEVKFLQMLKVAKVIVSVVSGFALGAALYLGVTTAYQFKLFSAGLSLAGSILAVGAHYYKTNSELLLSKVGEKSKAS